MATVKVIYVAGPLGALGGGMLRVTDYLIQAQDNLACYEGARMVKLDTRGSGNALSSMWLLAKAMGRVSMSHVTGQLAGVHVNMAERLSVFRKGVLLGMCRIMGIPTILHLHAAQMEAYYESISPLSKYFTRQVFLLASHVIVLGENSRNFVVGRMGVAPARVDVVINGVPNPKVARRIKNPHVRKNILFLGNLWERKGIADFIQALDTPGFDAKHYEVSVAGGGNIRTYIDQVEKMGLSDLITFAGWVDQDKASALLASADVMVLPSYDEGLPLVILEALANGVAVVCTPVGEIPTVMTDGVDVVFVTPGDVPGISAALHQVLGDEDLQTRLEINGRKVYDEKFSLERFSTRIAAIHEATFGLTPPVAGSAEQVS